LRRNLRKKSKAIVKVDLSFISKSAAERSKSMFVYLTEKIDSSDLQKFIKEIQIKEFVDSIKLISKKDAMNKLSKDLGEDFTKFLGSNPLMDALEITLKPTYVTTKKIDQIKANLKKDFRVHSITDSGQINFIDKYRDKFIFIEIRT
jgi:cell division transport system permease protein